MKEFKQVNSERKEFLVKLTPDEPAQFPKKDLKNMAVSQILVNHPELSDWNLTRVTFVAEHFIGITFEKQGDVIDIQ